MVQLGALHLRRLAHALPAAALLPHSLASRRAVEAAAAVARLETHVATIQVCLSVRPHASVFNLKASRA